MFLIAMALSHHECCGSHQARILLDTSPERKAPFHGGSTQGICFFILNKLQSAQCLLVTYMVYKI